ncbi:hypothetical protein HJFPF1_04426 [Paramyrothecium foliicola]|nr:hypothetical protein HJFPF1_04426 [Paramyrothecium foliicola]
MEVKDLKNLGMDYFRKGDTKMTSEYWAKACMRIISARTGPSWTVLASNKPFVDELSDLFFALNLNRAQNGLTAMDKSAHDQNLVEVIANSVLLALQSAFERLSVGNGWEPSPAQVAKLWFRKAKAHRLCRDHRAARQAVDFAGIILPDDPIILEEKRKILSLMS